MAKTLSRQIEDAKTITVFRARGDDGFIFWLRIKAMNKINVTSIFDATIQRAIGFGDFNLVPADLRNFQSVFFLKI